MFLQPTTPTNSAQERSSHLRWPESLSGAAPIPSRFSHLLNEPLVINLNNTTSEQGAASRLKEMDEEEEEKKAGVKGKEEDEGEVEEEEEEGEEEGEEEEDIVWLATPDDEILSQSLDDQEVAVYFEILEQAPLETLPLARKFCFKPNSQLVLGRAPSSGVSRLARVQQVLAQDKRRSAQAENGSDDGLFPNQVISKVHAVVYEVDGQLILEDRGSTHGTFVNEERIQSRVLQDNDHVRLGRDVVRKEIPYRPLNLIIRIKSNVMNGISEMDFGEFSSEVSAATTPLDTNGIDGSSSSSTEYSDMCNSVLQNGDDTIHENTVVNEFDTEFSCGGSDKIGTVEDEDNADGSPVLGKEECELEPDLKPDEDVQCESIQRERMEIIEATTTTSTFTTIPAEIMNTSFTLEHESQTTTVSTGKRKRALIDPQDPPVSPSNKRAIVVAALAGVVVGSVGTVFTLANI